MYEKRTVGTGTIDGGTAGELTRYIYGNHLQSASLELDGSGDIISYEEYHPFGTTSYQAMNASMNAIANRYRYTGKERDDESGLYYHGARYYAPWLARWTAVDPTGIKDGINDYVYCSDNPILKKDVKGTDGGTWTTNYDANGNPVYSSTGDQAKKDIGKPALAAGQIFLDSEQFNALKKLLLDPKLNELKLSLKADWNKKKASLIVGGIVILVPTAVLLGAIGIKNPKLDVPIVGSVYAGQPVAALASLGVGALTEKLTDDRFKLTFSYEKKDDKTDIYGFEITLSGKKPSEEKQDKPEEKKSPEKIDPNAGAAASPAKTDQQKQEEQLRKDIAAPAAITVGGKFGGGGGQGSVKIESPTSIGRFTIAPALQVAPQVAPYLATNLSLTTIVLGNRLDIGASVFVNAPAVKDSPFDVKYDDKTHFTTVTSTPPLSGTGGFLGVRGQF